MRKEGAGIHASGRPCETLPTYRSGRKGVHRKCKFKEKNIYAR